MHQTDDQFNGVISGFETLILLNSERLFIKIESHSKQSIYQALIEYKNQDPFLKEVKKTFHNLTLLYEYINEFSQDPERIKINLQKSEMKIIKNVGPRKLKNAPVLMIPLVKKFIFEKKQKTSLQIQIESAIKQNEILQFKFSHIKRQRTKLINEYQQIQQWMKTYCKQNQIDWNLLDLKKDTMKLKDFSNEGKHKIQGKEDYDLKIQEMIQNGEMSQFGDRESLFFESEPIRQQKNYLSSKFRESKKFQSVNLNKNEANSQNFDPFSYM